MRSHLAILRPFSTFSLAAIVVFASACEDDPSSAPVVNLPEASTSEASSPVPPAVACNTPGVALCDGACVSTVSDPKHCGGCDKACAAGEACANGACVAECTIGGKSYASGTINPSSSCEACTPATSSTAWTARADGSPCNPGQVCKTGVCAPKCFIGGVVYDAGAANPTNDCELCAPATSTTAFTPRATVPLLVGGEDVVAQGWMVATTGPAELLYGVDFARIATSTASGASTSGHMLVYRPNAVDPTKAWKIRVTMRVDTVNTHNQLDSAAAIMGGFTAPFGVGADRSQMVYLDAANVGWADNSQSAAFAVTDGSYHVYELAVDAAKVATLSVDGAATLTRNDYASNGTIAIGDQTNDPNVDATMRIKSVERVCP